MQWVEFGLDERRFWYLTPYMIGLCLTGAKRRADNELNRDMRIAWNTAMLQRQRQIPALEKLLIKDRRPTAQTAAQQTAIAKSIADLYGGTVARRNPKRVRMIRRAVH